MINPLGFGFSVELELRVDADSNRPQNRLRGDYFHRTRHGQKRYTRSFVVDALVIDDSDDEIVITGPIIYYDDPVRIGDTIEVRNPRVMGVLTPPPPDTVIINGVGRIRDTYLCNKISECFRFAQPVIDDYRMRLCALKEQ